MMNKGVELMLQRMDTHPEEFNTHNSDKGVRDKWKWVTNALKTRIEYMENPLKADPVMSFESLPFLSDREIILLYDKYMSIQADSFSRRVMSTLLTAGNG
jgi:hypothetical protein